MSNAVLITSKLLIMLNNDTCFIAIAIQAIQKELREIRGIIAHQKPVLNLQEAARFTGFSTSHIYKLTSSGGIPCCKRGKHLYFKTEELEQWLLSNRKATKEEIDALAANYVAINRRNAS